MDFNIFNIQLVAKNEVMGYLAVAGTIVGVLIGLFGNGWLERRKRKQGAQNIRLMIYREVQKIRGWIGSVNMIHEDDQDVIASELNSMTETPIYDAYIGQLSTLNTDESNKIDALYSEIAVKRNGIKVESGPTEEILAGIEKQLVRWQINRILRLSTEARDCMEQYTGKEGKVIKADYIQRSVVSMSVESDKTISQIIGCEPEEVAQIRAETLMEMAKQPIAVDADKTDDI